MIRPAGWLLCLFPLIPAVAGPVNLIVNGSFENGDMNAWFQNHYGFRPPGCGLYTSVCEFWNAS